jgi:hypothetical protein
MFLRPEPFYLDFMDWSTVQFIVVFVCLVYMTRHGIFAMFLFEIGVFMSFRAYTAGICPHPAASLSTLRRAMSSQSIPTSK